MAGMRLRLRDWIVMPYGPSWEPFSHLLKTFFFRCDLT